MFFSNDDDESDFMSPAGSSKLASLFGGDKGSAEGDNESLKYTAPKEPKKKKTAEAEDTKGASQTKILCAVAVHSYKYVDGKPEGQGKLGAAILANPDSAEICIAKAGSAKEISSLFTQDLAYGEGGQLENGDSVEMKYGAWIYEDGNLGEAIDTSATGGVSRFKLGRGKVIKGWDEGVFGMRKAGKRLLIIPPSLGSGSELKNKIPANSIVAYEVEILRVKLNKEREPSPREGAEPTAPAAAVSAVPSAAPAPEPATTEDKPPFKSDKAKLISRIAKMGQPMLPIVTTDQQEELEDQDEEGANSQMKPGIPTKPSFQQSSQQQPQQTATTTQPVNHPHQPHVNQPSNFYQHPPQQQVYPPVGQPGYGPMQGGVASQLAVYHPHSMQMPMQYGQPPPQYNNMYGQPQPAYQPAPTPTPPPSASSDLALSEARQNNTELRISMNKVTEKIDRIYDKVETVHSQQMQMSSSSMPNMEAGVLLHNITRIVQENERLRQDLFDKNNKVENQNEKINELIQRNQKYIEQSNMMLEQRSDTFKQTASTSQEKVLALEQDKVKLTAELSAAASQISSLQLELASLKKRECEIKQQLDSLLVSDKDQKTELSTLRIQGTENANKVEQLSSQIKDEKRKRKELELQHSNLQEEYAELKNSSRSLEKALSEKKQKSLEEKEKLEQELEELKSGLEKEIAVLKERLKKERTIVDVQTAEQISKMEEDLSKEWKDKTDRLLATTQERHKRAFAEVLDEKAQVEEKVKALEERLSLLKSSRGEADDQAEQLRDELDDMKMWKDKYDNLRGQATNMKEKYENKINELEKDVESVQEDKQNTIDRARQLQAQLIEAKEVLSAQELQFQQQEKLHQRQLQQLKQQHEQLQQQEPVAATAEMDKEQLSTEVKKIMSTVFQTLRSKFQPDGDYSGSLIQQTVLTTIKTVTLNMLSGDNKPEEEDDEEDEESEEEASLSETEEGDNKETVLQTTSSNQLENSLAASTGNEKVHLKSTGKTIKTTAKTSGQEKTADDKLNKAKTQPAKKDVRSKIDTRPPSSITKPSSARSTSRKSTSTDLSSTTKDSTFRNKKPLEKTKVLGATGSRTNTPRPESAKTIPKDKKVGLSSAKPSITSKDNKGRLSSAKSSTVTPSTRTRPLSQRSDKSEVKPIRAFGSSFTAPKATSTPIKPPATKTTGGIKTKRPSSVSLVKEQKNTSSTPKPASAGSAGTKTNFSRKSETHKPVVNDKTTSRVATTRPKVSASYARNTKSSMSKTAEKADAKTGSAAGDGDKKEEKKEPTGVGSESTVKTTKTKPATPKPSTVKDNKSQPGAISVPLGKTAEAVPAAKINRTKSAGTGTVGTKDAKVSNKPSKVKSAPVSKQTGAPPATGKGPAATPVSQKKTDPKAAKTSSKINNNKDTKKSESKPTAKDNVSKQQPKSASKETEKKQDDKSVEKDQKTAPEVSADSTKLHADKKESEVVEENKETDKNEGGIVTKTVTTAPTGGGHGNPNYLAELEAVSDTKDTLTHKTEVCQNQAKVDPKLHADKKESEVVEENKETDKNEGGIVTKTVTTAPTGGGHGNPNYLAELEAVSDTKDTLAQKTEVSQNKAKVDPTVKEPHQATSIPVTGGRGGNPYYAEELENSKDDSSAIKAETSLTNTASVDTTTKIEPHVKAEHSHVTGDRGNPYYAAELENTKGDAVSESNKEPIVCASQIQTSTAGKPIENNADERKGGEKKAIIKPETANVTGYRGNPHYAKELESSNNSDVIMADKAVINTAVVNSESKIESKIKPERSHITGDKGNPYYAAELENTKGDAVSESNKEPIVCTSQIQTSTAGKPIESNADERKGGEKKAIIKPETANVTGYRGNPHYAKELESSNNSDVITADKAVINTAVVNSESKIESKIKPERSHITGDKGNPYYAAELEDTKDDSEKQSKTEPMVCATQVQNSATAKPTESEKKNMGNQEVLVPQTVSVTDTACKDNDDNKKGNIISPEKANVTGDKGNPYYAKTLEENDSKKGDADKILKVEDTSGVKSDPVDKKNEEKIKESKANVTGDKGNPHYAEELEKLTMLYQDKDKTGDKDKESVSKSEKHETSSSPKNHINSEKNEKSPEKSADNDIKVEPIKCVQASMTSSAPDSSIVKDDKSHKEEVHSSIEKSKANVTGDKGNPYYAAELEKGAEIKKEISEVGSQPHEMKADKVQPNVAHPTGDKGNPYYALELEQGSKSKEKDPVADTKLSPSASTKEGKDADHGKSPSDAGQKALPEEVSSKSPAHRESSDVKSDNKDTDSKTEDKVQDKSESVKLDDIKPVVTEEKK